MESNHHKKHFSGGMTGFEMPHFFASNFMSDSSYSGLPPESSVTPPPFNYRLLKKIFEIAGEMTKIH